MYKKMLKILIFFACLLVIQAQDEDLRCTKKFCEDFLAENSCIKLPNECEIQNVTHNGLILPYPGPCNCCDYCIANLDEEDSCPIGSATSGIPSKICGSSLFCHPERKQCVDMHTPCALAQKKYDEDRLAGNLGELQVRPECDEEGNFVPYFCIPGEICYCVDEDGFRIFGDMDYTSLASAVMKCKCSRAYNSLKYVFGRPLARHEYGRCKSDGSYDPIQCIGDDCLCVDVEDGQPTYPGYATVDINQISNRSMYCFDDKLHVEFDYYKDCEAIHMRQYKDYVELRKEGLDVIGTVYPKCALDGTYEPVQYNNTHEFCADPDGNILEDFIQERENESTWDETMNCKCARARYIINNKEEVEKPVCCPNGNYQKIQCRRGKCRCVDENGYQIEKEQDQNDIEKLSCYNTDCVLH